MLKYIVSILVTVILTGCAKEELSLYIPYGKDIDLSTLQTANYAIKDSNVSNEGTWGRENMFGFIYKTEGSMYWKDNLEEMEYKNKADIIKNITIISVSDRDFWTTEWKTIVTGDVYQKRSNK